MSLITSNGCVYGVPATVMRTVYLPGAAIGAARCAPPNAPVR